MRCTRLVNADISIQFRAHTANAVGALPARRAVLASLAQPDVSPPSTVLDAERRVRHLAVQSAHAMVTALPDGEAVVSVVADVALVAAAARVKDAKGSRGSRAAILVVVAEASEGWGS